MPYLHQKDAQWLLDTVESGPKAIIEVQLNSNAMFKTAMAGDTLRPMRVRVVISSFEGSAVVVYSMKDNTVLEKYKNHADFAKLYDLNTEPF